MSSSKKKKSNRDDWCTPEWLWKMALKAAGRRAFDVDPFSNELSTVRAKKTYIRRGGEKHVMKPGEIAWANGPFSKPRPWFEWAYDQMLIGGSVYGVAKLDTSTLAWKEFGPSIIWLPPFRIEYVPPPGVEDESGPRFISAVCLWTEDGRLEDRFQSFFEKEDGYVGWRS